jgi:hypothetical protein
MARFLARKASVHPVREVLEKRTPPVKEIGTLVDLPLALASKHVLAYAAEESERISDKHIGSVGGAVAGGEVTRGRDAEGARAAALQCSGKSTRSEGGEQPAAAES